jgi:hypothetical protein
VSDKEDCDPDRRRILQGIAAGSSALVMMPLAGCDSSAPTALTEAQQGSGALWDGTWHAEGVLNASFENGVHVLQAGSDVYPSDRRAVAFREGLRFVNGSIEANIIDAGNGGGLVLRRTAPHHYYAAIVQAGRVTLLRHLGKPPLGLGEIRVQQDLLGVVRGVLDLLLFPDNETVLAAAPLLPASGDTRLRLSATSDGRGATRLQLYQGGAEHETLLVEAEDRTPALQGAGEAGVLATSQFLLTEAITALVPVAENLLPALASIRTLLVTGPGLAVMESVLGQSLVELVTPRSTSRFRDIVLAPSEAVQSSPAHVVEATTLEPVDGGALVSVITDLPARVHIEYATSSDFAGSQSLEAGDTNAFNALFATVPATSGASRVYWRAHAQRNGLTRSGSIRSFRPLPRGAASVPVKLVLGSCATEFGWPFRHMRDEAPDALVWLGDIFYVDAMGPLAQTQTGYAGLWKDILCAPELRSTLDSAYFAPQRDDHDYGRNDAFGQTIPAHAIDPWEGIVHPGTYYRFDIGPVGVWVIDQRRFQDDPALPDTVDKSLIGIEQREWLLDTLAASDQPFKLIASPMPLFFGPNVNEDWSKGFTAERDLILDFLRTTIPGHTVFVSGDSHSGAVIDAGGMLEMRVSPFDIPFLGWVGASRGEGVQWSGVGKFYATAETGSDEDGLFMDLRLIRVGVPIGGVGIAPIEGLPPLAVGGLGLPDERITTVVWQRRLRA